MLGHRGSPHAQRSARPVDHRPAGSPAGRDAGRLEAARRALEAAPHDANAHYELGRLVREGGAPALAVPHFVAALRAAPERPAHWLALTVVLIEADRADEARAIAERFRAHHPDDRSGTVVGECVALAFARARARYDAGDLRGAEGLLDLAIGLDETHVAAIYLAGVIAARTNRLQRAFDLYSIAIYRDPDNADFFNSLGVLLTTMADHDGAVQALERALALRPDLASAHANLAGILGNRGERARGLAHARRAIALDPGLPGGHINLGTNLKSLGRLPEAIAAYDRALAIEPASLNAHSNRLFAKLYADHVPIAEYAADARAFGRRFADPLLRRRPFPNDRDPGRRLRVGFVSGDLRAHAVARFFEPFLRHLDRSAFWAHAYMTHGAEDAVSERLRRSFDGWANVSGLTDDAAADLVEADRIDVLVDLSGHSAGNRLLVFARKPAPVQVTWMGHPATTGLTAIDYRLTDWEEDPPGAADELHAEALWRLPRFAGTYLLPDDIPDARAYPPLDDNGHVTFGVLNRFEKIGRGALEAWARILDAVPDARLFMVVDGVHDPEVRAQVEDRLAEAGVPVARVRLHPRVTAGHFRLYHEVDVALDPFPYNGGTTSCETLCMGVPFVALRGGHAAARVGAAVLTAVGLEELVADTREDYVARAVALARDTERLRALRAGLRARVVASPLTDHAGLAAAVGAAWRAMWVRWVGGAA